MSLKNLAFLPPSSNPSLNPKVTWMSSNLKEIIGKYTNVSFLNGEVTSRMKLSALQNLLQKVISDKDHFNRDQHTYVIDSSYFCIKTVIYGIIPTLLMLISIMRVPVSLHLLTSLERCKQSESKSNRKKTTNAAQQIYNPEDEQS